MSCLWLSINPRENRARDIELDRPINFPIINTKYSIKKTNYFDDKNYVMLLMLMLGNDIKRNVVHI